MAIETNPNGRLFATLGQDRKIRIFDVFNGKLTKTIDESLIKLVQEAKENKFVCCFYCLYNYFYRYYGLQNMEWNRRLALERDMDKDPVNAFRFMKISWDKTGHFLMYPSPVGIKVR